MAILTVTPVRSGRDLDAFLRLPWQIYERDPHWIPPFLPDARYQLDRRQNPFFEHADAELFLARRGDRVVGRISAAWNPLFNAHHGTQAGWFGWFECEDVQETAHVLLEATADWCRARGATRLLGPASFTMVDECGVLLDGFDRDPVLMMAYNPPYYSRLLENIGCSKLKDLFSYRRSRDQPLPDAALRLAESARRRSGVRTRAIDYSRFEEDLALVRRLYNRSWERNWGSVPITEAEILSLGHRLRQIAVRELVRFAFVDGDAVGLSMAFPDFNQVVKRIGARSGLVAMLKAWYYSRHITGCRAFMLGVLPEYRLQGIDALLWTESETIGRRLGYQWMELAWTLEDNAPINAFAESIARRSATYRIYERRL